MDRELHGTPRTGVIGAGIAGLAAALTLREHGHHVVVLDKGRGPGGRSSSRRADPFAFDHGAQYFTARDADFRQRVEAWLDEGVVARWEGRIVSLRAGEATPGKSDTERFVGTPRMSALALHLARDLEVRQGVRVARLERAGPEWLLRDGDDTPIEAFERLIVTAPPAQAVELLGVTSALGRQAAGIVFRPCLAVLLGLAEPYGVDFDGAFCEDSPLSWIARNSSKPGRPSGEAWVLHASPAWSDAHFVDAPESVTRLLCMELERVTGVALPLVVHADTHRWRYALPDPGLDARSLSDSELGLALAGDGYNGGRIEGAYLSGVAAAGRFLHDHARPTESG